MVGFVKSALNLFGIKNKEGTTSGEGISLDNFLEELPTYLGYSVSFKNVPTDDGSFRFEVEGDERDSFVGPNSEILDALSHVSMRVLRRASGASNTPATEGGEGNGAHFRVVFDSDGFRDRKVQELKQLAEDQRKKVMDAGGKPAYISALGPSERKVIHTHLAELGEVVSESIGKGTFKRIRIKLKEDSTFRKPMEERAEGDRGPRRPQQGGRRGGGNGGGGGRNNFRSRRPRNDYQEGNYGNAHQGGVQETSTHDERFQEQDFDDNIGNRLAPGEEPVYKTPSGEGSN